MAFGVILFGVLIQAPTLMQFSSRARDGNSVT
jgi:hypothetical protein